MSYVWDFFTSGYPSDPELRDCHRGPMTDLEVRMAQPFSILSAIELQRKTLLNYVVDTHLLAVRTRECVLRTVNSDLGPLVTNVYQERDLLQALICEKRRALDIEADIVERGVDYVSAAQLLQVYGLQEPQVVVLEAALKSNSPIVRVSGKCAVIVIATLIELGV